MRTRSAQPGFVLLMALVLVLLAGTLLAGVVSRSMLGALESQGAALELQRRWAVASCRSTFLGRVEELLDKAERGESARGSEEASEAYQNKPMAELRVACSLAGIEYELVFTDEQAKMNLNSLSKEVSLGDAQAAVERLIVDLGTGHKRSAGVRLRMLVDSKDSQERNAGLLKVGGYGQVFEGVSPEHLIGQKGAPGIAQGITCWGDGKVNLRRAPAAVIERACEKSLRRDVVRAFLAARDRDPYRKLSAILGEIKEIDEEQVTRLAGRVTDQSSCHGLWVIARGSQRSWYTLAVGLARNGEKSMARQDDGGQDIYQCYEFTW